jgi:hypothetical protein
MIFEEQEFRYKAPDGCHYDFPEDYYITGILGFCGCANELITDTALQILYNIAEGVPGYNYKESSAEFMALQECIIQIMDDKKLVEHGSSIRFSWDIGKCKEIVKEIEDAYGSQG